MDRQTENNERLVATLKEARGQILTLKEEIDRLAQPPSGYGVFLSQHHDGTVDVFTGGRELRVAVSPSIDPTALRLGQRVLLNDALAVVDALAFERTGEVVTLKEILDGGDRALVVSLAGEERVVHLAATLTNPRPRAGDSVLIEPRAAYAFERVPRSGVEELVFEEIPDVEYRDIGGLDRQIKKICNAVELPFRHADLFRRYELRPPKGVLLYGPPGCGKTLVARAVVNSLAKLMRVQRGESEPPIHFLNVRGSELPTKYVGETEHRIRMIFRRVRDNATEGAPVIVLFDEMDAIFRARAARVSADVENTIVPQLLTEIDGVKDLANVILIGASNREDLIDPAILRPGRFDLTIKVERPNADAAMDIFAKCLTPTVPIRTDHPAASGADPAAARASMIRRVVEFMYADDPANRFVEVTYQSGVKADLYYRQFMSGAIIQNVVDRAKQLALLRTLEQGEPGIGVQDLLQAAAEDMGSAQHLASVANADDWSRISAAHGERIVYARTLTSADEPSSGKTLEISY